MRRKNLISYGLVCTLSAGASACASAGGASHDAQVSEFFAIAMHRRRAAEDAVRGLGAEHLERATLIAAVLARNPGIDAALQAWRASLARYRQAGALDDPMLMASIAPLSIASSKSRFGFDVEISQRFPLGGKLEAQEALAAAETRSASSDFSETRLKLALIASDLFDDYALAVRSIAIEADHIALVSALKENATALYASGNATAQDALQADAELARLEYQVSLYETQRDVAVAQLNALLHRVPTAALPPPSAAASQERDNAEVDAAGLATAIDKRPDVVAAAARVRVAGARVEVAEREAYPDLTVSTSYNSMWDMPEHRWMAGVGVNIPLQRERRRGALDEASAMRAAAESEVQSTADMARGELAVAARQLQQARRAVQLYEQHLLPLARERIEAARASFTAAQTTFMSVIEAERGFRTAELELELARADLSKRKAGLERALGRVPGVSNSEVQP